MAEEHVFQTEVKQMLNLLANSLYSNKEVFLRELISNASDAADKLRFKALTNNDLYEGDPNLRIRISVDKDAKTLTISDNGIGMSEKDAIDHLGTIAKSGTAEFIKQLSGDQAKNSGLIGQFGVGFYSAFIVADKVTVESRAAGDPKTEGVRWVSDGTGTFSTEKIEKEEHGTSVILHIKDDEKQFLDDWQIRSIIEKYSDHIGIPVEVWQVKTLSLRRTERSPRSRIRRSASGSRSTPQPLSGPASPRRSRTRSTRSSTSTSAAIGKTLLYGPTTRSREPWSTPACSTSLRTLRSI